MHHRIKSNKRKGKINKEKVTVEIAHLIKRLDSLTGPQWSRHLSQPRSRRDGDKN